MGAAPFQTKVFMYEIDLGSEVQIKIKYAGAEYLLREPTVEEIEAYQNQEGKGVSLAGLLEQLGMPKEVVGKMGVSKARQLVEGLLDLITKKK